MASAKSDQRMCQTKQRMRRAKSAIIIAGGSALALFFTANTFVAPAEAQFLRWWSWHQDDGPPPIPPGYVGKETVSLPAGPPQIVAHPAPAPMPMQPVSTADIRRTASRMGLRLIATPLRNGRLYIAFAEDEHGLMHHLTFDAYAGTLIDNETVDHAAHKIKLHPAAIDQKSRSGPATNVTPTASAAATTTIDAQASAATPAANAAALNARDLTPIQPEPPYLRPAGTQ